MSWQRPDGRQPDELRPISFEREFTRFAPGSVLAKCGGTQVLCTVTIQEGVPKFLEGTGSGWLTAEYRMLPSATPQRQARELLKLSGRTQEIQRLIGRSLRASLDLKALGERTVTVDADVLQADAGTRTTSITGSYIALADALEKLVKSGQLERSPLSHQVAAISVGLLEGEPC
jgi:ribonuclease PH